MNNNYLTDTHFHLDLDDDIDNILENARKEGVRNFIISGCDLKGIEEGIKIINKYENIYLTIGIHPDEINDFNDITISYLEKLILENEKIIGIGEIGLDYYHNKENKESQKRIFKLQLDLSQKLDLPVVIHSRDAFLDTYNILKEYDLKGTIHCFSGSLECAKMYIDLGYLLGIGGVSTYKNTNLTSVLKEIDLNHIVFETDSPYLTPEPIRTEVNEPKNVSIICDNLCQIKNKTREEVIKITTNNVINNYNRLK
ncbi:MAG: TatD family hydrolase [Bacilli bacterium]|nr:TatD family hydrolase [Bacilli bacterium]